MSFWYFLVIRIVEATQLVKHRWTCKLCTHTKCKCYQNILHHLKPVFSSLLSSVHRNTRRISFSCLFSLWFSRSTDTFRFLRECSLKSTIITLCWLLIILYIHLLQLVSYRVDAGDPRVRIFLNKLIFLHQEAIDIKKFPEKSNTTKFIETSFKIVKLWKFFKYLSVPRGFPSSQPLQYLYPALIAFLKCIDIF